MEPVLILIALLLIAFFSGIEIAFVSANKLRIELLKEKGSASAKIISNFNSQPARFLSSMLIGLNISLVVFGSVSTNYFTPDRFPFFPQDEVLLLLVQTIITTFIILIFGELIPKILFRVNSDSTLLLFSYPVQFFYVLLSPLSALFHSISRWLIKSVFRVPIEEGRQAFTEEDLEYLVKETAVADEGEEEEADHLNSEIFEKALYLKDVRVRNCMVPRPEVQAIDVNEDLTELRRMIIETKLSRILVYDGGIDKILGYVHHFDILKKADTIRSLVRSMPAIPESMTARDLMLQFIRDRKNIAWVVDEYGGTAGIITLEDIMEQIFGEIQDEHDDENLTEKKISDTEFLFSGRLEIDYLNNEYELNIPEGDYSTLSGYIVTTLEDIPEEGSMFNIGNFEVKVMKATDKRLELLRIKVIKPQ